MLDSEVQRSLGSDHCSQPNYDQKRNTNSDGGELEIAGEVTVALQGLSKQRSGIDTKKHLPCDGEEPGLAARVPAGSDLLAQRRGLDGNETGGQETALRAVWKGCSPTRWEEGREDSGRAQKEGDSSSCRGTAQRLAAPASLSLPVCAEEAAIRPTGAPGGPEEITVKDTQPRNIHQD